jgi:tRNA 2-thiouridine synthesizing protein A
MSELLKLTADKVVDARGTSCPGPLLETKRAMATIPIGAVLETISSDAGTKADVPVWAKKMGHEYLGTVEENGYWKIYVRRKK